MLEFHKLSSSTKTMVIKFNGKWGTKVSIREILHYAPDERSLRRFIRKYPARCAAYEAACQKIGAEESSELPSDCDG